MQGYKDWTIKDLENFDRKNNTSDMQEDSSSAVSSGGKSRINNTKIKNIRNKM